jgi:hypothetical protein
MQCILQANGDARFPLLNEEELDGSWGGTPATATLRKYDGIYQVKIFVDAAFDMSAVLCTTTLRWPVRRCRERR